MEGVEDPKVRKALGRRLDEYMRCGQRVLIRSCGGCGSDRRGSGTFRGTRTCKSRACATCAWVRARGIGEGLESAFELVDTWPGYSWQMAVVSIRWTPGSTREMSVAGLRERAMLARRVGKKLWDKVLKRKGAGLLRSIEVSARGYVHLNLVYYGPPMDGRVLQAAGAAVDCRVGRVHVQELNTDPTGELPEDRKPVEDPRGSRKAVRKVGEYVAKGHERTKGSMAWDEGWLAGDRTAEVVDPQLAARWEIATYRLHLLERYGAFRGLEMETMPRSKEDPEDHDTACESCGVVGDWKWAHRPTERWLQDCHDAGSPGLLRSSWVPPPEETPY